LRMSRRPHTLEKDVNACGAAFPLYSRDDRSPAFEILWLRTKIRGIFLEGAATPGARIASTETGPPKAHASGGSGVKRDQAPGKEVGQGGTWSHCSKAVFHAHDTPLPQLNSPTRRKGLGTLEPCFLPAGFIFSSRVAVQGTPHDTGTPAKNAGGAGNGQRLLVCL